MSIQHKKDMHYVQCKKQSWYITKKTIQLLQYLGITLVFKKLCEFEINIFDDLFILLSQSGIK